MKTGQGPPQAREGGGHGGSEIRGQEEEPSRTRKQWRKKRGVRRGDGEIGTRSGETGRKGKKSKAEEAMVASLCPSLGSRFHASAGRQSVQSLIIEAAVAQRLPIFR